MASVLHSKVIVGMITTKLRFFIHYLTMNEPLVSQELLTKLSSWKNIASKSNYKILVNRKAGS